MRLVGSIYQPDVGEHQGHVVVTVATDVPVPTLGLFDVVNRDAWPLHSIVKCECGAMWHFNDGDDE